MTLPLTSDISATLGEEQADERGMHAPLAGIPWDHTASDLGSVWEWSTPHFTVTVTGDSRSFYVRISDQTGPKPRIIFDSNAATFDQAELLVRETIGKSYDLRYGYSSYSGPLATTFTLANGQRVDLSNYEGELVRVSVLSRDGTLSVYQGAANVRHYHLVVADAAREISILPSHIKSIEALSSLTVARQGTTQIVEGTVERGCTGRPGFLPGTLEHDGTSHCPVHG